MYDLVAKIGESTDADAHELWDGALHRQIAQVRGNRFFLHIFDVINRVRQDEAWQSDPRARPQRRRTRSGRSTGSIRPSSMRSPPAIPVTAGEAMRQHLLTLQESLIRITSLDHSETEIAIRRRG